MIGAIFGPICALLVFFLPIAGLADNPEAHKLLAIGLACMLCSGWISNTATAAMMFPIAIATAVSLGFSPLPVCVVMALCTSLAFMLPVSTPPNAITYSSGYIPITKMIKAGVLPDIIGVFIITVPLVYFLVKAIMGV